MYFGLRSTAEGILLTQGRTNGKTALTHWQVHPTHTREPQEGRIRRLPDTSS